MAKPKPKKPQVKQKPVKNKLSAGPESSNLMVWGSLTGILAFTLIAYLPALQNGFVWDDLVYIQKNPLIYTLDLPNIFSSYLAGNYHPVTVLVHALEYHFFKFNESGYHFVNVFVHLLNTALVFYFIRRLTGNLWVGLITALFFGIHPLHVESVAWVSELKDLLYTFFFLGSLIAYLHYVSKKRLALFMLAIGLFLLSLLSKGMAVSLPFVLLAIDLFKGRLHGSKVWLEKIPFFILSVTFGIMAVFAQQSESALHGDVIPVMQRIVFACYGYMTYLQKLFLPLSLSAYYPYPVAPHEAIPVVYYGYVLLVIAMAGLAWYSFRKAHKVFFGLGFFTITIFLVLKLLPVGYAVMADRYTYIPSIGIFFLAAEGLVWFYNKKGNIPVKPIAIAILLVFTVFYSYTTYERTKIWENDLTLWSDVIEKDQTVSIAYLNRGVELMDNKQYAEAEPDLIRALELNPDYADAYYNRGILYQNTQRFDQAFSDYNEALSRNPSYVKAYVNRGNIYRDRKQYIEALADYDNALALDPSIHELFNNKGILFQNQGLFEEALLEYTKAIQLKPDYINAFINRGNAYSALNRNTESYNDYNQAIALNPQYGLAFYARALLEIKNMETQKACADLQTAVNLGYTQAREPLKVHCQ